MSHASERLFFAANPKRKGCPVCAECGAAHAIDAPCPPRVARTIGFDRRAAARGSAKTAALARERAATQRQAGHR